MQVWLAGVFILFGLAELLQWIQKSALQLPIFIIGGVGLAIASNYTRRAAFPLNLLPPRLRSSEGDGDSHPIGD
jgi:1,4-dihydroxy-2-naphthoate octaprenyltransferase